MAFPSKSRFVHFLQERIQGQLMELQRQVEEIRSARATDSKSSAGDKYETSRAMADLEIEKLGTQMEVLERSLALLSKVDAGSSHTKVQFGSMVQLAGERYFVAVGIGRMVWEESTWFIVSADAPIGKLLAGKTVGETVEFKGKSMLLEAIG